MPFCLGTISQDIPKVGVLVCFIPNLLLRCLLKYISWNDFHSFASTCRHFRLLISHPDFRDVILSHYIPGYRLALSFRDLNQYREVQIDMHDLALLST